MTISRDNKQMNNTITNSYPIDANYIFKKLQTFEHALAICNTHNNIKADEQFNHEIRQIKTMIKKMTNVKQVSTSFNNNNEQ